MDHLRKWIWLTTAAWRETEVGAGGVPLFRLVIPRSAATRDPFRTGDRATLATLSDLSSRGAQRRGIPFGPVIEPRLPFSDLSSRGAQRRGIPFGPVVKSGMRAAAIAFPEP